MVPEAISGRCRCQDLAPSDPLPPLLVGADRVHGLPVAVRPVRDHYERTMNYTDEQLRAIEHTGGHSLTYAVAGSGKTHRLVGRVLFLLEQGIPA